MKNSANPTHSLLACVFISLLLLLGAARAASAQLPFLTDDADTTEMGKFHVEFSDEYDVLQRIEYPGKAQNAVIFTVQYGIAKQLEVGFDAPMLSIFESKTSLIGNPSGIGDSALQVKWRVHDESKTSKIPALAAVFSLEIPTGSTERELGSGVTDFWLYGVAQKSFTKKTVGRLNAGILFAGDTESGLLGIRSSRGQIFTGGASLTRNFTPKLLLGAELFGAVTNRFKLSRGQVEGQVGGTYSFSERFSLAFGVLAGRFAASPRVGAVLGFAYDFK